MASPGPPSPRSSRTMSQTTPADSNAGALPPDVLFDVLLRLPAKELCRLRAVCCSWRSLTVDPIFTGAHAARHPGPLLLAKFRDDGARVHVVDLSGSVVKQIDGPDSHKLLCTRLDLACVATTGNSCLVFNPATGGAYALPESLAPLHVNRKNLRQHTFFASGRVMLTGEFKVLRLLDRIDFSGYDRRQLVEVFTINDGVSNARWRARESHYPFVEANNAAVAGGVVYFLLDRAYECDVMEFFGEDTGLYPDIIASFDLGTEKWRRDIQGPISSSLSNYADEYRSLWQNLILTELNGSIVLAYHRRNLSLNLWFLSDFENNLWLKEYSIQTESAIPADEYFVKPFLVLDGGKLVILLPSTGILLIYDPRINTFARVETRRLDAVGIYTGNLLSLQRGNMV